MKKTFSLTLLFPLVVIGCMNCHGSDTKINLSRTQLMSFAYKDSQPHLRKSPDPWGQVARPTAGPSHLLGEYTAGCLAGAETLPLSGQGYEVMHPKRNRYYGHASLMDVLIRAGVFAPKSAPLMYGDLGQPRGGPMLTGHASHQIGLDVDIWLYQMTADQQAGWQESWRETLSPDSVVAPDYLSLLMNLWKPEYESIILWFAQQPEVERIFVNAAIKKLFCQKYPTRTELIKIRPWFYHTEHFHVRLACPPDQPDCRPQTPSTASECGPELDSWFEPATIAQQTNPQPGTPQPIQLPTACTQILNQ